MRAVGVVAILGLIALGASTVSTIKPTDQATRDIGSDCSPVQAGTGSATLQSLGNNPLPNQASFGCFAPGVEVKTDKPQSGPCCVNQETLN